MLEVFSDGVRRRLLYRRLCRAARRCDVNKLQTDAETTASLVRRQKAIVRLLTKILTTSQLQTLQHIVRRRTYSALLLVASL